jgi:hypothetical protein
MAVDDDKKQYRSDAQEWYFRLMNGPEYFERWTCTDNINAYNNLIGVSKTI